MLVFTCLYLWTHGSTTRFEARSVHFALLPMRSLSASEEARYFALPPVPVLPSLLGCLPRSLLRSDATPDCSAKLG